MTDLNDLNKRLTRLEIFASAHGYSPEAQEAVKPKPVFTVRQYGTADQPMDYEERQEAANADGCICYIEHHFNSCGSKEPRYAACIVATNAGVTSRAWGCLYTHKVHDRWPDLVDVGADDGIKVGGYDGRGNANLIHTAMPAILVEPLFASNPNHAAIIRGQKTDLARILVESIREMFPAGGLVAFSVGHKYKVSKPNDRGAAIFSGGSEADAAEEVLRIARELLEAE